MGEGESERQRGGASPRAMVTGSKLRRVQVIHRELREASGVRPVNCSRLSEILEVDRKTVLRDIALMRDDLDLPIEYDESRHSYYYMHPVGDLPLFRPGEGEMLALFVAQRALGSLEGTPLAEKVARALQKIAATFEDGVTLSLDELADGFSFRQAGVGKAEAKVFDALARAVRERREVAFEYRKLGASRSGVRHVRPYHLVHVDGLWYLLGFDLRRGAERTFALPRVRSVQVRKRRFEADPGFDVAERLRSSFGIFSSGGEVYRVRVRFDAFAAQLVREREWHASQEVVREFAGGAIEMALELGSLHEVKRWVLGWGRHARVLAPPELVEMVADEVRAMAGLPGEGEA